jgi:hypothetical protein
MTLRKGCVLWTRSTHTLVVLHYVKAYPLIVDTVQIQHERQGDLPQIRAGKTQRADLGYPGAQHIFLGPHVPEKISALLSVETIRDVVLIARRIRLAMSS